MAHTDGSHVDPWVNPNEEEELRIEVARADATFEGYTYRGTGHLFADTGLEDYEQDSAEMMCKRVKEVLSRLGSALWSRFHFRNRLRASRRASATVSIGSEQDHF